MVTDTPTERENESMWIGLRRRKVVQWGLVYGAAAWGFLQGLEYISGTYDWPRQIQQLTTLALLIGLPIVLVLAWYHGDRGQQRISTPEFAILTLLLLLGGGAFWHYQRASDTETASLPTVAKPEAVVAPDHRSIAVLPFADMSAEKDQEYMSDGIAEELLNLLAKVTDLKVIARTSSFAFKGEKAEIAEIAKRLNVAHVLEGSVRTAGNKVRITAQLVRASDSSHLWSQTYDRPLNDIFAVQDDIAAQVVEALKLALLVGEPAVTDGPQDMEAYNLYLQGRFFVQRRTREDGERALRYLQQSLRRNPNYAPAWVELANVYLAQMDYGWATSADATRRAREAAEKALALDSNLAAAHSALAWTYSSPVESEPVLKKALKLEPNNADALRRAGITAGQLGKPDDALRMIRRSIELDPLDQTGHEYLCYMLCSVGRYVEAEAACRKGQELSGDPRAWAGSIGVTKLFQGHVDEALQLIQSEPDENWRLFWLSLVYHTLGRRSDSDTTLALLKEKYSAEMPFHIAEVYAWRDENDLAFEWLNRAHQQGDLLVNDLLISPYFKRLQQDPRHRAFLQKMKVPEAQ